MALASRSDLTSIAIENCQLPDSRGEPDQAMLLRKLTSVTIFGLPSLPWLDIFYQSRLVHFDLFLRVLPAPIDDPSLNFPRTRGDPAVPSIHPVMACHQLREVLYTLESDHCRYACLSDIKTLRIVHASRMPNPAYQVPILEKPDCTRRSQSPDGMPTSPIEDRYIDWYLLDGWQLPAAVSAKILTKRVDV